MARPETLVVGNCYFSVGFYDQDLVLPMIETLVYVGQEDDETGADVVVQTAREPVSV